MAVTLTRFHWADYAVTVTVLAICLCIGFFFACYHGGQRTKVTYLLGDRRMSMVPVCLSLFVTFQSAISLIGTPAEIYNTGTMFFFIYIGIGVAYVVGYFTVVPLMYPLHLTSIYEYLSLRFKSVPVRLLATGLGMLQTLLYMAVALFAPALALQAGAGFPLWVSVFVVGGIGTFYTAVGGIKSVVWTDAFQCAIMFIGITAVIVKGLISVGGFTKMLEIAAEGGRLVFDEVDPDVRVRHNYWNMLIGGCIMWQVNCFNQSSVQRISSMQSLKDAKRAFLWNLPMQIVYGLTLTLTGVLIYAYVVTEGCDPYAAGLIQNQNQMVPYFVIQVLNTMPGMAGLYMSMIFSGALSTVSSGINALSANTVEDILARTLKGKKDSTVTVIAKILVAFYGCVAVALAYLLKYVSGPVPQMGLTVFGACGGPVLGMFVLGASVPQGNRYGAMGGGLVSMGVSLWLAVGGKLYGAPTQGLPPGPVYNCSLALTSSLPISSVNVTAVTTILSDDTSKPFSPYDISYMWIGTVGFLVSFIVGIIISLITDCLCNNDEEVDTALFFPFCRKLYGMPDPVHTVFRPTNFIALDDLWISTPDGTHHRK